MYAYVHTRVHTQVYMRVHRHMHTWTCICVHRCVCVPVPACCAHPHRHHGLLRVPQPRLREGHARPRAPSSEAPPRADGSPGSCPGLLASARHADPHLHGTLLHAHQMRLRDTTACTHHVHEARVDHATHSRAGSWAHLHIYTETHTHSSSCVQVFTPTREHSRATHAQKQHKHPDACVHAVETHILAP